MDRISELKIDDFHWESLAKLTKEKLLKVEEENEKLKVRNKYLEEEIKSLECVEGFKGTYVAYTDKSEHILKGMGI